WNAALTSDYMFRGASQSDEEPALQLGAVLNFSNGLYVGVWGSNVDFADQGSPDIDLDYYIGWNTDLSERWSLDLMINRYTYLGEADDYGPLDYNEFITTLTLDETLGFVLGYTNDVYALDDDGWYYGVTGNWTLADTYNVGFTLGRSTFASSTGYEDYSDWSFSVGHDWRGGCPWRAVPCQGVRGAAVLGPRGRQGRGAPASSRGAARGPRVRPPLGRGCACRPHCQRRIVLENRPVGPGRRPDAEG